MLLIFRTLLTPPVFLHTPHFAVVRTGLLYIGLLICISVDDITKVNSPLCLKSHSQYGSYSFMSHLLSFLCFKLPILFFLQLGLSACRPSMKKLFFRFVRLFFLSSLSHLLLCLRLLSFDSLNYLKWTLVPGWLILPSFPAI